MPIGSPEKPSKGFSSIDLTSDSSIPSEPLGGSLGSLSGSTTEGLTEGLVELGLLPPTERALHSPSMGTKDLGGLGMEVCAGLYSTPYRSDTSPYTIPEGD